MNSNQALQDEVAVIAQKIFSLRQQLHKARRENDDLGREFLEQRLKAEKATILIEQALNANQLFANALEF